MKDTGVEELGQVMFREKPNNEGGPPSCPMAEKLAVKAGCSVLARCSEDGLHYLGVVDSVGDDSSAVVTFVDYGNTETVAKQHVYKLLWPLGV